jgi:hypothetical protein
MAKYFVKCKCGNDEFKYVEEVDLFVCPICDFDNDRHFHMADMITELTDEELDRIIKEKDNQKEGSSNEKNIFLYNYEDRLNQLLERDNTNKDDNERKVMFYIIAGNDDLYSKVNFIYNFKKHSINLDCFEEVDFCSSSCKLIKLAFNLYNSYPADVLDTFYLLDEDNFNLALNALKIRLQRV